MKSLKTTLFFIKVAAIIGAAYVLSQYPGEVYVRWFDYDIQMSIGLMLAGLFIGTAAIIFLSSVWRAIWNFPVFLAERRTRYRRKKGGRALLEGFSAIAAGEGRSATKLANKALNWNADQSLNHVLAAQAAHIQGNHILAGKHFSELTKKPQTAFLGLRGLIIQAQQDGDWPQAHLLLQQAQNLRPSSPWVLEQLFELSSRIKDYSQMPKLLESMKKAKHITKKEMQHHLGILEWLKAVEARNSADEKEFISFAQKAHKLAPDILTVAMALAAYFIDDKKFAKASRILKETFQASPHVDLLPLMKKAAPKVSYEKFYSELEKMAKAMKRNEEARFALAQAAINAKLWGQARKHLNKLTKTALSQRVYQLMAELESKEYPDEPERAKEWWDKVPFVPHDPHWNCQGCGATHQQWQPVCGYCHSLGKVEWSIGEHAGEAATPLLPTQQKALSA